MEGAATFDLETRINETIDKILDGIETRYDGRPVVSNSCYFDLRTLAADVRAAALEEAIEAALKACVPCIPYMGDDGRGALENAADDIRALKGE